MALLGGDRRTVPVLIIAMAALVGYMGYTGTGLSVVGIKGVTAQKDSVTHLRKVIDSLQAQTDSAKKILARGSVADLRRRLDGYRASLQLMRRLVPDRNEVPNLLDAISTRAKIRGVSLAGVVPLAEEPGPAPFNTFKYQLTVNGHFDQIGEFLSDVASLERIIVPIDVRLQAAPLQSAKALGDSTGAMLEASFLIRTYIKTVSNEGESSGT